MKNAMEILKAYEILMNTCSGKEELKVLRSDVKKILKVLQDEVLEDIKQNKSKES